MENDKEKLNILFIRTDFYGALTEGGTATVHRGQIEALMKEGHSFFYASSGSNFLGDYADYHYIPYNRILLNIPEIYNLPYSRKFSKIVSKIILVNKPNFFIQQNSLLSIAGSLIKKETGLPFVLHCDGVEYWAKMFWGKRVFFPKLIRWAEELQWESADIINVPSSVVRDHLIEYGANQDKIVTNHNGVNLERFNPSVNDFGIKTKHQLSNSFIIGYIGSFSHWHGTEVLAQSIKYLKEKIPNIKVLFVGDGLFRPIIEEIVKKDNVADKVVITGMVPYDFVPNYMSACNILTSPCINNDNDVEFFNSPVKLFEYMAMGKPVVASDVGQQGVVIEHMKNGLLCQEKDPQELADSIYKLYKDPDLMDKLGRQARIDAVEKYDWKVYNQRIIDAYHKLGNRK